MPDGLRQGYAKSKDNPNDAPHLIYLPELFSQDKFVEDVQNVLKKTATAWS